MKEETICPYTERCSFYVSENFNYSSPACTIYKTSCRFYNRFKDLEDKKSNPFIDYIGSRRL